MALSENASFIILYMHLGYFFHSLHFSSHERQNGAASHISMLMRNWSAHSKCILLNINFTSYFWRLQQLFKQNKYLRGRSGLQRSGARGEVLREMSTLSLCINSLESSSKEHLHVYTSRTNKGGWCPTDHVACTRAAAEVSLFYSHVLSWECTLPGLPHEVTVNSELTRRDALNSTPCLAALNALANASGCNGGRQQH